MGADAPVNSGAVTGEAHSRTGTLVVGVAGKCCTGKDLVTRWFLERRWRELNVDRIGHRALEVLQPEILAAFGPEILQDDRSAIDRKRLGRIVFTDRNRLRELEAIVHPWMREEVRREVEEFRRGATGAADGTTNDGAGSEPSDDSAQALVRGLVINAALLFHMRLDQYCDAVVLVRAPLCLRLLRALRRDGFSWYTTVLRLWRQRTLETQAHRSPADIITVDNRGTPEALHRYLDGVARLQ